MRPTTLERAFELAETGRYMTTVALAAALKAEGYHSAGTLLAHEAVRKRVSAAMLEARLAGAGAMIEDASVGFDPAPRRPTESRAG